MNRSDSSGPRVLFQIRFDAFSAFGGDTFQMRQYHRELQGQRIGTEISTSLQPDLDGYDLVHLFNIDRPMETFVQMQNAKRQGKHVVLSSIHHPFRHIEYYERYSRKGVLSVLPRIFASRSSRECFKDFFRVIHGRAPWRAWRNEFRLGQLREQKEILQRADAVCLLARAEEDEIQADFGRKPDRAYVIRNGCNGAAGNSPLPAEISRVLDRLGDFVLVAGRIEARKNQIGVINALKGTKVPIVFAGGTNPWHRTYVKRFLRLVGESRNLVYLGRLDSDYMPALYSRAKAHLLASWFEVSPLVDLEAAYWGCNVVTTTRSYSSEYASDFALFCDPANPESIRSAVLEAFRKPKDPRVPELVAKRFSWHKSATKLLEVYKEVLEHEPAP